VSASPSRNTVAEDDPMIVRSPIGIEILVYREADGSFRIDGWEHLFFVERGILIERQLVDPTAEIRQRRFRTIEEPSEAVDQLAFAS
jgi:hypothetical protein